MFLSPCLQVWMFQGSGALSKDHEQEGAVGRVVSISEDACEEFPCSKLCEIFERSREEKADIWIKNCWSPSVFGTEYLAANKVNWSVAYLFGWVSRANKSLIQEADWLLREEWGWKNIFLLRMLSKVLFPFADYSHTAFFPLHLCKAHLHLGACVCSWRVTFWWNIRAESFALAMRLVHSCLVLSSTSHQKLIVSPTSWFYWWNYWGIDK